MFGFLINAAHAQTTAAAPAGAPGLSSFLPFLLMIVVVYFLILRPQMRQQKEIKRLIAELKIGDEVVLVSGIHGKIAALDTATLSLKIADGVTITVDRAAVQTKKDLGLNTKLK